MSLTGIFLILFLTVHLIGNLQLLAGDGGEKFNIYADFMGNNTLVQIISKGNFFFILLHAFLGIALWLGNRSAKGGKYAVNATKNSSFASRNMAWLGWIILFFITIHLYQFYLQMKFPDLFGSSNLVTYGDAEVRDLYTLVAETFSNPINIIVYVISMIAIAFHLNHGFQSAFQTLGLNHKKYTPIIKGLGAGYSILVPLLFAAIPIVFYLTK